MSQTFNAWEVATLTLGGKPKYYPITIWKKERDLLLVHNVVKELMNDDLFEIHLHGQLSGDITTLLSIFHSTLRLTHLPRNFEDLSKILFEWCRENYQRRLFIILHAFEKFTLNSQHFLYTILEATTALPISVICLTNHYDALDALEKRVKSRFSQNVIYLSQPKTFDSYFQFIESVLLPDNLDYSVRRRKNKMYMERIKEMINEDGFISWLQHAYDVNREPSEIFPFLHQIVLSCSDENIKLSNNDALSNISQSNSLLDQKISELSVPELCALVAFRRTRSKYPDEIVTFEAIFDEYSRGFADSAKSPDGMILSRKYNRTIMKFAIDSLISKNWMCVNGNINETINCHEEIKVKVPMASVLDAIQENLNISESIKRLALECL